MTQVVRCSEVSPVRYINPQWVCDGHNDCGDWYDELHCAICEKQQGLYKCRGNKNGVLIMFIFLQNIFWNVRGAFSCFPDCDQKIQREEATP